MTREEREKSLINARRACLMLVEYAVGKHFALILGEEQREAVSDLLIQFERLDGKERRQVEGGKKGAKHGKKGGRPAKKIARKERKRKA